MFFRHWTANRAVAGTVIIRYRAPITNALNPRGAAPPLELRTEDGGFSGDASTFLLLPESARTYRIALRWNFAALGSGAVGLSTLGAGDVGGTAAGPSPERKLDALYGAAVRSWLALFRAVECRDTPPHSRPALAR